MRQKNIPWVGALVESVFNALPFLSIIISIFNFFSIIVVLYSYIKPYISNITLPIFIGFISIALFIIMGVGMVLIYKYVTPSLWTFRNKQMNKYESEIMSKLIAIEEELKELKRNV